MDKAQGTLTLLKRGNGLVRIPAKLLETFKLTSGDKFSYTVEKNQIILTPMKKKSSLRKMFDGFDSAAYFKNKQGNKEADWGGLRKAGRISNYQQ